ncbi:Crp/Fnr family transcriptional regulator [Cellulomonas fimi]|uniref:Crp/Fnr family transcriptional regulator n=1 Tax=Cellulomonas fimi TaxID=1708 RepID=A0A7Y0LY86_CELFI|nr:Crp/Fnr family transcriptional regulator [Cellulomonas fimi]NMR20105.1 Crp/Fnr family transcriptional regulator [Cellulomonas fimi]
MSPGLDQTQRNAILASLPANDATTLATHLREEPLTLGTVLHEPNTPVHTVYFPLTGVVSIVTDVEDDDVVEVATVGHEGMVGLSLFLGADAPTERALVQVSGHALAMSTEDFLRCSETIDGPLNEALRRFSQTMFTQLARNSACNRIHPALQRAARWLLMTSDRMHSPTFDLTQEFLAQMLAVRRASVSQIAQTLAKDACITYTRGTITITDRDRLHGHACNCYDVIRAGSPTAVQGT